MFLGDMAACRPRAVWVQDGSKTFCYTREKVLKHNDGDINQRHKNHLGGALTGEFWHPMSTNVREMVNICPQI